MDAPNVGVTVMLSYDVEDGKTLSQPKRITLPVTTGLAQVFAKAAAINEGDSTPLSFTSLLAGIVSGTDTVSRWLRDEFQRAGLTGRAIASRRSRKYDEAALERIEHQEVPRELPTSQSARQALEKAQEIRDELDSAQVLDVRHVVAAYPILRSWHDKDFEELRIDRLAWCRGLGANMAESYPNEKRYWRRYADRAAPVPLTSFSADVYTERDLLEIDRSVDALALLICSAKTDTPLSIGIFGEWGSGKSFFMRHLRKRIWTLAARQEDSAAAWIKKRNDGKATAADEPLYYGRVAQVEFNAWHYNEGNVVASLVDHLFRNLKVLPGDTETQLDEQRAAVLADITGTKVEVGKAAAAVDKANAEVADARAQVQRVSDEAKAARVDVDALAQKVEDSRSEAENARKELDDAIDDLTKEKPTADADAVLAVALSPITDSPTFLQAKKTAQDFAAAMTDWRKFAEIVGSRRGLAVIGLCLAAPVAAWVVNWLDGVAAVITGVLTVSTASMGQIISFIRDRRKEFETKLKELEQEEKKRLKENKDELEAKKKHIEAGWDARIAALRDTLEQQRSALAEREKGAADALSTLATRTKELEAKVEERAEAEKSLAKLEARLSRISGTLLLEEFIKSRSGADEYQKQLGFLALVRRDFERLSDLIAKANKEWGSPTKTTERPSINRIVLYIDDLDRCKVETVIHVLEAVHLLLAFPLFVCVVAVDPRWIEDCLKQKRNDLFSAKAGSSDLPVTVGDYLEKIFQIPIWMSPIDSGQRATLVKTLLGTTAAPPKGAGAPEGTDGEGVPLRQSGGSRSLREARAVDGFAEADGFIQIVVEAEKKPDPLQITEKEARFVDEVALLLSDKPRALKRFVNTYRLLKASLSDIDRMSFVSDGPSSPYKMCISQLAFFTGQPRLAPLLVRKLATDSDGSATLADWLEAQSGEDRTRLEPALKLFPESEQIELEMFRSWLPDTSKYLFHREHRETDGLKNPQPPPGMGALG